MKYISFLTAIVAFITLFLPSGSYAGQSTEVDGHVRMRYDISQSVDHGLQLYEAVLGSDWTIDYWINTRLEVGFEPMTRSIVIRDLYVLVEDFPDLGLSASGNLLIGRTRNKCFGIVPTSSNRRTSGYGILSEYITSRRVTGIQYFLEYSQVHVNLGAFNGFSVTDNGYGTEGSMITLAEIDSETNRNKEISIRFSALASDDFKLGFSGSSAKLTDIDLQMLNGLLNSQYTDKTYSSFGIDVNYQFDDYLVQGEIYSTTLSEMESMLYSVLGGLNFDDKELSLRLAYLTYGGVGEYEDYDAGWDKFQITPSFVYRLSESYYIQIEANINAELKPSGGDALDNSELYTEFRLEF